MLKHARLVILFFLNSHIYSENILSYNDKNKILDIIGSQIKIIEDKEDTLSFIQILSSKNFASNKNDIPNFGVTSSSFWLKFEIKNTSDVNHLLLNIKAYNIDEISFYLISPNKKIHYSKTGNNVPFYQRVYKNPGCFFDLIMANNSSAICFIKIKGSGQIITPIFIGSKDKILESVKKENLFIGIFIGIFLGMFFYNLFIYFSTREKVYLYYVSYLFIVALTQLCILGYTFQFFWPNSTWLASHSLFLLSSLVGITSIEFTKEFLSIKRIKTRLNKVFFTINLFYVCYFILTLFDLGDELYNTIQICAIILSFYIFYAAIKISRTGYKPANYFILSWTMFLIGVFIFALKDFGILPYNYFTLYSMPIGSALETVLLSFALADRINILKKEKEKSQDLALTAMREKRKVIADQNKELEKTVAIRTQELQTTLSNLKDAQVQLVNAEKMASLGQLTAGIAHEINNPINFVTANIKPLKLDIVDLLELLNKYEALKPDEKSVNQFKEIEKYRKDIDIEYIKKEMDDLLTGIENGAQRTADIVVGLKNFSRLDESEIKKANINEGILSTLLLIKRSVPDNTEVITELGEIPFIECLPGKLNQVFMNLFSNALYAIAAKKDGGPNKLTIKTFELGDKICMSVEDTGIGMSEEVKNKIFEPFFTTKDVGEGTGLGMSIVFKIVENHQAKLEVESQVGIGTKFLLTLNKNISELKL
jgi:signal transduction histidine kinase